MTKTITTGTKITFTETGDKFELIKNDTGFEVKPIKLSKSIPTEHYTFQEFFELYESGNITISGFEDADVHLIKQILTNYIHTTEIASLKAEIATRADNNAQLIEANAGFIKEIDQLKSDKQQLQTEKEELEAKILKQTEEIGKLNDALAAIQD